LKFRLRWRERWYEFDLSKTNDRTQVKIVTTESLSEEIELYAKGWLGRGAAAIDSKEGKSSAFSIDGVIFDLDGVLTDTSEFHYLGWKQLADEEGIDFDREANEKLRGLSRRDSLLQLLGDRRDRVTEEEIQEMMARKNRYYEQSIRKLTSANLLPGAEALLNELRSAGIKIGIGSSSKNARMVLQQLGISDRIDAIADGHSVERHKPAPDVFLHAAKQLELEPARCLVVEDATSGVAAALAAGMWTLGLGPAERVGAAHIVRNSLEGSNWADLLTQLQESRMVAGRSS
jgi:beta-phosphoglucomutase